MTLFNHARITFWLLLIIVAPGLPLEAMEKHQCLTQYEHGSVNWSCGTIRATGRTSGLITTGDKSPDAFIEKAKLDARHNLIKILNSLAFNKESGPPSPGGDAIMAGIEKQAMDAVIGEQNYTSDRAMEVTIETEMFGGFLQLVLPDEIGEISPLKIILPQNKPEKSSSREKYTGLIIDARGLDFQPVIYPVVMSEQGDEIYSARFISREFAVQKGVCLYACSPDLVPTNQRTGPNPLTIRGLRRGGKKNRSIVISRSDAETIEKSPERHLFMKECRVVILLDQ